MCAPNKRYNKYFLLFFSLLYIGTWCFCINILIINKVAFFAYKINHAAFIHLNSAAHCSIYGLSNFLCKLWLLMENTEAITFLLINIVQKMPRFKDIVFRKL